MIVNKGPFLKGKIDISDAAVTVSSLTYTGSEISVASSITVVCNGNTLTSSDYTLGGVSAATIAGTYTAKISGVGLYTGEKEFSWSIARATVYASRVEVYLDYAGMPYMTSNPTSSFTVTKPSTPTVGTSGVFINKIIIIATENIQEITEARKITDASSGQSYIIDDSFSDNEYTCNLTGQIYPRERHQVLYNRDVYKFGWQTQNTVGEITITVINQTSYE